MSKIGNSYKTTLCILLKGIFLWIIWREKNTIKLKQ